MKTIRLNIAYDGSAYHGWQIQSVDRSVEGELTRALMRILSSDEPVKIQGASRTDAGVHSRGQVAHFHHDTGRTLWDFSRGLNALTDDDICVVRVEEAEKGFHARHSARGKIYRYRIWNHRYVHPFYQQRFWRLPKPVDVEAMAEAAQYFVGEHDFAGFRSVGCASPTTVRRMKSVEVRAELPVVEIEIQGDAFLQHMVRIMVGTLVAVGLGKFKPERIARILEEGDRRLGGRTAPAGGLTLEKVFYPEFPWRGDAPSIGGSYLETEGGTAGFLSRTPK